MKKVLAVLLVTLLACAALTACGAKKEAELKPGVFAYSYEDEIDGQKVDCVEYLYLLENGNGYYEGQDKVDLTWSGNEATCDDGRKMTFKTDGENLIVTLDGQDKTFVRTDGPFVTKSVSEAAFNPGYFVNAYEDEIDGQKVENKDYLILLDDGKGFYSAQDIVDLTWTWTEATCADGTKLGIKPDGNNLTVTRDGQEIKFTRTFEDLPKELEDKIDSEISSRDYAGKYSAGKSGDITLTGTDKGSYDVVISFPDLGEMKGDGNNVDGAVEIGLTDSNGKKIYGIFFPVCDTYTFRVTQSESDKIKEQMDFIGFIKQ